MKARHEFNSESAYRDYLRHYYAGEMAKALIMSPDYTAKVTALMSLEDSIAGASVKLADAVIAALDAEKERK